MSFCLLGEWSRREGYIQPSHNLDIMNICWLKIMTAITNAIQTSGFNFIRKVPNEGSSLGYIAVTIVIVSVITATIKARF